MKVMSSNIHAGGKSKPKPSMVIMYIDRHLGFNYS